ncbi:MAG TPA: cytochrome c oxidase subunit II [Dehalococcoidia bacterium]|nr:cytochrome c oxidase subunit II [Dehalococcoidia bacterium]
MIRSGGGVRRGVSGLGSALSRRVAALALPAVIGLGAAVLAPADPIAAWPGSPFDPHSPQAQSILNLFVLVLLFSGLVFVLVESWLFLTIFRYRQRPGAPIPRQIAGHRTLEITWTAIPVVFLIIVFIFMVPTLSVIQPPAAAGASDPPLRVTVIGHQWWWEYRYPDLGIITANELHIPVGVPVALEITSDDVIHAFWVPELNGKIDAVPGKINPLTFLAQEAKVYGGQCTEFCGIQHAWMLNPVFADPPDVFNEWVRTQQTPVPEPADPLLAAGRQVFLGSTCVNCHTVAGTTAQARVGPDLSHLGGRTTLGAGVLTNTPENLRTWLTDLHDVKPGARMPAFSYSDQDTEALVAYLTSLK